MEWLHRVSYCVNGVERGSRFNTGNVGSLKCSYRENRRARSYVSMDLGFL